MLARSPRLTLCEFGCPLMASVMLENTVMMDLRTFATCGRLEISERKTGQKLERAEVVMPPPRMLVMGPSLLCNCNRRGKHGKSADL